MAWKDLKQDIEEELGFSVIDDSAHDIRWSTPFVRDNVAARNYNRWYYKQVFYPKHREELIRKRKERYEFLRSTDPSFVEHRREISRKSYKKRMADEAYRKKRVARHRERKRLMLKDPIYRAKHNAMNRASRQRVKARKLAEEQNGKKATDSN